jgi:6-pyruvoyltetrahydropterin/6-carboxytetrahydropterin synthase
MRVELTRTVGFRATHRFWKPEWTEAENRKRFGWTADQPGHAHDYQCAVTVGGAQTAATDLVMDLPLLDRILAEAIVAHLDGKHLNLDLAEFAYGRALPTCEALARHCFTRIVDRLPPGVTLVRVRIVEDATLYAECLEGSAP